MELGSHTRRVAIYVILKRNMLCAFKTPQTVKSQDATLK
jgi:hypothetical protein